MSENPNANENVDSDVLIDQLTEQLESVTRLDPVPPSFSDLPNEILGEIVQKLDLVSRLKTRKVSRRLRSLVDKQKAEYGKINIHAQKDHVHITFDEKIMIHYCKSGCWIYTESKESVKHKYIEGDNFLEIALNDLTIALKKPKFQLEELELVFEEYALEETLKILEFFPYLKYPIHVKYFEIENHSYGTLPILSLLKPGTLEEIVIRMNIERNANELVKMDQWKQAKVALIGDIHDRPIPVDIEDFLHFDDLILRVDSLSANDVLRLRDVYSKSTSFERCDLEFRTDSVNIEEIGIALGAKIVQTFFGPTIFHCHPIPRSNKFLAFKINCEGLTIARFPAIRIARERACSASF